MPGGRDGEARLLVRQYGLDVKVGMSPLTRGVVGEGDTTHRHARR